MKSLNYKDFFAKYVSFSFDPIITNHICKSFKSNFVESESFVTKNFDLDHTFEHSSIKMIVDLEPNDLLRQLIHDHQIAKLMPNRTNLEFIYLLYDWT